ncbi:MAG TPA: hypothetical protein VGG14_01305 [Candidatus Sulfotelmatobacter sp.]|jgi:hypothetical protein
MNDPEVKRLIDKAEQLKAMSDRLLEQGRKLKKQADQLITESKKIVGNRPKLP